MRAHLLHRCRDFDWKWALQTAAEREATRVGRRYGRNKDFDPQSGLPWNAEQLTADLGLLVLFSAMAGDDDCIFEVARKVILDGAEGDLDTILYRQDILRDCLGQAAVIRELYAVAVEALAKQKAHYLGVLTRHPDWVLRDAVERMSTSLAYLKRLRAIADRHGEKFVSEGWIKFFEMLKRDLGDEYFILVQDHLEQLRFRNGELLSAELGRANKGRHYLLHRVPYRKRPWWALWTFPIGLFGEKDKRRVFRFELHPRDEAGFQALAALRNRGISLAADVLGQSADHVRDFFSMLRVELAFYVGCINLHERLIRKREPSCIPLLGSVDEERLSFQGLYDIGLTLTVDRQVVGNDADADLKNLVIVTGPNSGGKSTFLRSVGLAQLMMQSGMFVPAVSYHASVCRGLFTHYKREEDVTMKSGKFDEELSRMSDIIDHVTRHSMILFNESFAATNEREGSEIARQIMSALLDKGVRIVCVTHMYELAHGFYQKAATLFLRAGRQVDGSRSFKLTEGEPLSKSYGEDLYNRIFAHHEAESKACATVGCVAAPIDNRGPIN